MEVRVIIEDGFISVNGESFMGFDLSKYADIKAIQSIDGKTHVLDNNGNGDFDDDFDLSPFVTLFNDKKKEIEDWEKSPERAKEKRIYEIKDRLTRIDFETIRPLRAGETDRVAELETKAETLRTELQGLEA